MRIKRDYSLAGVDNIFWGLSHLSEEQTKAIEELEKKFDATILAFSSKDIQYAELNEEQLKELKDLEEKLGLSLVTLKMSYK
ncbi:hypothetical protein V7O62_02900 [Methanolobus sp. ZRKC2]|uniref:hypothetical protein n=1 Tax=Methanolobus sp. ZRKC2 TaxID=3125783 RepID=UPI0032498AC8